MIPALKTDGIAVAPQGDHEAGPWEVYQDGLLGHVVGLLRAQLSAPHADTEGEQGGEGRRAMGRTIDSVWGKVPNQALNLPGYLKETPFLLRVGQVWDAFGQNSKEKEGILSTKISAMSLKSVLASLERHQ
eukprot:4662012-Prorocentrum_lima.AAC.1